PKMLAKPASTPSARLIVSTDIEDAVSCPSSVVRRSGHERISSQEHRSNFSAIDDAQAINNEQLTTDNGQAYQPECLKWTTSPSFTTYSFPSSFNKARVRASARLPVEIKSSYFTTSARIK